MRTILLAFLALIPATSAIAAGKGDIVLQAGLLHMRPQESSEPLHTTLRPSPLFPVAGIEESFTSPGTSIRVSDSNTLAVTAKYFLTDHIGLQVEGGIPVAFDIYGKGTVEPTGLGRFVASVDLGSEENNPLASARQWSPVVMGVYHFREPGTALRPYIGLGVSYTWFTDVELGDNFERNLNQEFGRVLALAAGKSGDTHVESEAASDVAPVFSVGANYAFNERWGVSLSASYLELSTETTIRIKAEDGTTLATSRTDLDLNPAVVALLFNYTF